MNHFYFNECFPKTSTDDEAVKSFQNTIKEYSILKDKFGEKVTGILTDRSPDKITVTQTLNLMQAINLLDRDYKVIALRNFNKYPIDYIFEIDQTLELLEEEFLIRVGNDTFDALNAQISFLNNGILFSLGLHEDIRKNEIDIHQLSGKSSLIKNQFGESENTASLIANINKELAQSLAGFSKFLNLFDTPKYFKSLKSEFESLPLKCQDSIIADFSRAIDRNLETKFSADGDLIKDVTPEKEKSIKVYELRVFDPVAIRIYFYEKGNEIYLAKIKRKPPKKSQSNDIKASRSLIKELIKVI